MVFTEVIRDHEEKARLHKKRIQFPNFGATTPTFLTNKAIVCHVQTKEECVTYFWLSFLCLSCKLKPRIRNIPPKLNLL